MKNEENWLKNTLFQLQSLHQKERQIGVEILEILWEIALRKAYSELGYPSLFIFCVRVLGYSDAQAFQRTQAMWAMKETPEIKVKMEEGSLNMTTVAQVHTFIRQEKLKGNPKSELEVSNLFTHFENRTSREVNEELATMRCEKIRMKLILNLDEETETLWRELRDKTAHQTKGDDLQCLKLLLKKWKATKVEPNASSELKKRAKPEAKMEEAQHIAAGLIKVNVSRAIPFVTRKQVMKRDEGRCTCCGSSFQLQIEHRIPFAKGGTHELSNLRILCRSCNIHQGIKEFGLATMKRAHFKLETKQRH